SRVDDSKLCYVYQLNFIDYFFFFQAEDGIRDRNVTGVQTCALPIFLNTITVFLGEFLVGFVSSVVVTHRGVPPLFWFCCCRLYFSMTVAEIRNICLVCLRYCRDVW